VGLGERVKKGGLITKRGGKNIVEDVFVFPVVVAAGEELRRKGGVETPDAWKKEAKTSGNTSAIEGHLEGGGKL